MSKRITEDDIWKSKKLAFLDGFLTALVVAWTATLWKKAWKND